MTEHDYKATVVNDKCVTWAKPVVGRVLDQFVAAEHAKHFAAKLNAPDLTAEVERLTAERDVLDRIAAALRTEVGRLRAAEKHHGPCRGLPPDPEAPPIPCVEVDPTDGRRTWRAMGEDVRTLGDEWERHFPSWASDEWASSQHEDAVPRHVYLTRRTPPAPRTVTVELPIDVARRFANPLADLRFTAYDEAAIIDGCRAALTEDGDR